MLFRRFFHDELAQTSYLLACQHARVALIVDPNRDIDRYIDAAAGEGLRITHVTETHIHADFVSGARDLARETGAQLYLSGAGGPDWAYAFATEAKAKLLEDGSNFMVGDVRIDALHTPGHTPEHMTFLVTDTAAGTVPMGALTGDFIFVSDVGRPDLLEIAAGVAGTKEVSARDLFKSLQKFKALPDYLQLWPGHGAGSACGKALGAMPQSTLGYERIFNWGLAEPDENVFVRKVLSGQPEPPAYFAVMKRVNRDGPPPRTLVPLPRISARDVAAKLHEGAPVVDTRPAAEFAERHAASTVNIPHTKSFLNWAGALLPYDRDVFLIVPDGDQQSIIDELSLIGLNRIGGVYGLRSLADLESAGVEMRATPQVSIQALNQRAGNGQVIVDVRAPDEWEHGHIPGAVHIPLGSLQSRLDEVPKNADIAVHCQGGNRSAIAASILQKNGFAVSNITGGFAEWERYAGQVERSGSPGG
ncbi:MAG TPA: MBL fold metallo-hydrolase [Gemmatimonadaceae bacterium]|nr:MBL fold metallo-hydrolase [Gemmatimonadaceae bacterium]